MNKRDYIDGVKAIQENVWYEMVKSAKNKVCNETIIENITTGLTTLLRSNNMPCFTKSEVFSVIKMLEENEGIVTVSLSKLTESGISLRVLEKMITEDYVFYWAETKKISFHHNIQAIMWKELYDKNMKNQ